MAYQIQKNVQKKAAKLAVKSGSGFTGAERLYLAVYFFTVGEQRILEYIEKEAKKNGRFLDADGDPRQIISRGPKDINSACAKYDPARPEPVIQLLMKWGLDPQAEQQNIPKMRELLERYRPASLSPLDSVVPLETSEPDEEILPSYDPAAQ